MPRLAVVDDQVKSVALGFAVISRHRPASLSPPGNAYKRSRAAGCEAADRALNYI
jgi:hypothetical protein